MTLAKQTRFNRDEQFLLGINDEGRQVWLRAESWDCDWYWGFGYLASFGCHSHFDSLVGFMHEGKYIHHLNESPKMRETVLTDAEAGDRCDWMKSFYALKATAEIFHTGNSHLTTSKAVNLKHEDFGKVINQEL